MVGDRERRLGALAGAGAGAGAAACFPSFPGPSALLCPPCLVESLGHMWKLEEDWEEWIYAFMPSKKSGCVPGRPFINSHVSVSQDLTCRASEASQALGQLQSPPLVCWQWHKHCAQDSPPCSCPVSRRCPCRRMAFSGVLWSRG